jgi:hypothetical protein
LGYGISATRRGDVSGLEATSNQVHIKSQETF